MPVMNWGIDAGTVENFDRSTVFVPYAGVTPPTGVVYVWKLKSLKLVHAANGGYPQLRAGLELIPRTAEEKRYAGFYRATYSPVSAKTAFRFVPLLDALGVTEREFLKGVKYKEDGSITSMGRWKWSTDIVLQAQLKADEDQKGNPRVVINDGWFGIPDEEEEYDTDEEDDEYEGDEEEDDEEDF
jgi:hypothetical protein